MESPEDVEQLARSLAICPTFGERDRLRVIDLLRQLARLLRNDPDEHDRMTARRDVKR